jgi:1,4-alpha-glucan branching enzyme
MPRSGRWRVRFNSDWNGYDSEFGNWNSYDTAAVSGAKDGLPYNANVGIGPYSIIILSQGTQPDMEGNGKINLDDFARFAMQWQNTCDNWDSCDGADFNMSGRVDMTDLYTFLSRWLEAAP